MQITPWKPKKYVIHLKDHHVYLINIMASPGAGKTTTLVRMIEELKKDYRVGVMEADVEF